MRVTQTQISSFPNNNILKSNVNYTLKKQYINHKERGLLKTLFLTTKIIYMNLHKAAHLHNSFSRSRVINLFLFLKCIIIFSRVKAKMIVHFNWAVTNLELNLCCFILKYYQLIDPPKRLCWGKIIMENI